jgi:hypothetical protein
MSRDRRDPISATLERDIKGTAIKKGRVKIPPQIEAPAARRSGLKI